MTKELATSKHFARLHLHFIVYVSVPILKIAGGILVSRAAADLVDPERGLL